MPLFKLPESIANDDRSKKLPCSCFTEICEDRVRKARNTVSKRTQNLNSGCLLTLNSQAFCVTHRYFDNKTLRKCVSVGRVQWRQNNEILDISEAQLSGGKENLSLLGESNAENNTVFSQ